MLSVSNLLTGSAWDGAWAGRLVVVLSALIVVLTARELALATWLLWPAPAPVPAPARPDPGPVAQAEAGPGLVQQLQKAAPFGRVTARRAPPPKVEVPVTRLALKLTGVLAGTDGKSGGAIISDAKNGEQYVEVGQPVQGGAVLDEVHLTEVVLLRNGRQEVLQMEFETLGQADSAGEALLPGQSVDPDVQQQLAELGSLGAIGSDLQELMAGRVPASLAASTKRGGIRSVLRLRKDRRSGRFRLSPARDRSTYAKMGFKPGDLLVSVNGVAPTNTKEAYQMLDQGRSGGGSVEVERGRKSVTLSLPGGL